LSARAGRARDKSKRDLGLCRSRHRREGEVMSARATSDDAEGRPFHDTLPF
jgi:hypothetical protein